MTNYGDYRSGWIYYVLGRYEDQPAVKIGITRHLNHRPRQHKGTRIRLPRRLGGGGDAAQRTIQG